MRTLLFIHQAAELYGSDKTLLLLIKNLNPQQYKIVVLLPFDGPLRPALEACQAEVHITPVLKLYRKMVTPMNLIRFIKDIQTGLATVKKLHAQHHFDLIYSNTLAVLLGVFAAKKLQIPHVWHVHEIIESPGIFKKTFGKLLALKSTTKIVYNSKATADFWNATAPLTPKSSVIHNGLETPNPVSEAEKMEIRERYFHAKTTDRVFALVGRISRWKGQLTALEAFVPIASEFPNSRLLFIGSAPPNQEHFEEQRSDKGLPRPLFYLIKLLFE
jgi:glycosyltransferase involved in cell wall biosynthesis